MDTQLVPVQQNVDNAVMEALSKGKQFLPRIQLMTSAHDECKDGKFPINHFAWIVGKDKVDVGDRLAVVLLAMRPMAIRFGESPVSCYDPALKEGKPTGLFAEIKALADADSKSGNAYGMQFLVYVPMQKEFATFFCGNQTLRNEIKNFAARLGKAALLTPKKIETTGAKKFTYFSTIVNVCHDTPELPPADKLDEVMKDFLNPPAQMVETVSADEAAAASRG